ncbi:flavin reductase family protein [Mesorhizobium sp. Cs1299R1N3]|uniref:flavin reductase family protein n=1 Tax=Mesorhizobium sp. Cs1299R1N3 TaxID=3015173 RepID=UPI00301B7976
MTDAALIDSIKYFHRAFPTGVTIVTTTVDSQPYGLAVNAFASVSLDPPLVMVCVKSTSSTYQRLFAEDHFGVSILSNEQARVAQVFAQSGVDKFSQIAWSCGNSGVPLIDDASAQMEFTVRSRMPAGTHTIFVGDVTRACAFGRPPLVYAAGKFYDGGKLVPLD